MAAKKATKKAAKKAAAKPAASVPESGTDVPNVGTAEVAEAAPALDPVKKAEIDAAMAKIRAKAEAEVREATEAILGGGSAAKLGTPSGDIEDRQDHAQADHLPGTRRRDKTYVPERVYDERSGNTKRVLDHNSYHYCMVPEEDFYSYNLAGWKFCKFDGGSLSGLLSDGWQGTGDSVFMRDIRGYCRRGDVFLMYIENRRYDEIVAEDNEAAEKALQAPVGHFADVAYGEGIRAMAQVNGKDILEGKDAIEPLGA